MFLGRKNQYCENDYTIKCNLQIQCNFYQITNEPKSSLATNMEQGRKPRNKPMHLRVAYVLTKEVRIYSDAKTASSINGAGTFIYKMDSYM